MRHVIWKEGSSGPGVDAVREFLRSFNADLLSMASRKGDSSVALQPFGAFDGNLRIWVKQFQFTFNRTHSPTFARIKAKLSQKALLETGEVDFTTRRVMGIDETLATDDAILLPRGVVAVQSSLTAAEFKAAPRESLIGRPYRVANLDELLTTTGLKAASVNTISNKRIAPLDEGTFIVPEGHPLYAAAKNESECAALVQAFGVSNTKYWRRGPRVQDIEFLAAGTVIATLGTGVYLSDYSGKSHVGIFLRKTDHGIVMLDQYRGGDGKLGIRFKRFGAEHKQSRVKASTFIDPKYSYRMPVTDKGGKTTYARDFSLDTVRTKVNLTGDGSEYYVLLDAGNVVRQDSNADRLRTSEENRQAAKELVKELFEGVDLGDSKAAGEALRRALDGVKGPMPPADRPPPP